MNLIKCVHPVLRPYKFKMLNFIRVGSKNDGGYVIPIEPTKHGSILLSLGYGFNHEFEKQMIQKFSGIKKVYLFDGSADLLYVVKQVFGNILYFALSRGNSLKVSLFNLYDYVKLQLNNQIKFTSVFIGNRTHQVSLNSRIKKIGQMNPFNYILKCDIEGGEYDLINDIIVNYEIFALLIIEFHDILNPNINFSRCIEELNSFFSIVNININNNSICKDSNYPTVIELTFVNKGLLELQDGIPLETSYNNLNSKCDLNLDEYTFIF
jgi:hypothetical protein